MNLGKTGTDVITGFSGIITGYVEYLTGCNQYLLVPKCKKGEESIKPVGQWIDDSRIKIKEGRKIVLIETKSMGPDILPDAE